MFNTPILDIAIGLVFIFLLYSLLATSVKEAIATALGLRARMLRKGIVTGMLTDSKEKTKWESIAVGLVKFFKEFWYLIVGRPKKAESEMKIGDYFYDHPVIKNYGSSGVYRFPSYIPSSSFSTVLIDVLKKDFERKKELIAAFSAKGVQQVRDKILEEFKTASVAIQINELLKYYDEHYNIVYLKSDFLKTHSDKYPVTVQTEYGTLNFLNKDDQGQLVTATQAIPLSTLFPKPNDIKIDLETLRILRLHFQSSVYNVEQFAGRLETWFDESMDRVTGWYKRQAQYILFVIGFCLAISFNVDTLQIEKKLSQDKNLREQMVQTAIAYSNANKNNPDMTRPKTAADTIQSAITTDTVKKKLDDVEKILKSVDTSVNSVLALGWKFPTHFDERDTHKGWLTGAFYSICKAVSFSDSCPSLKVAYYKVHYILRITFSSPRTVMSFLILAIAVSLGAPFWFDMLSKIISIRGSGKQETATSDKNKAPVTSGTSQPEQKPVNINVNSQNKQEAVG